MKNSHHLFTHDLQTPQNARTFVFQTAGVFDSEKGRADRQVIAAKNEKIRFDSEIYFLI